MNDDILRFRKRRSRRLAHRFDGFMQIVYGTLKSEGVDVNDMEPGEAIEKFNELKGKEPKAESKEAKTTHEGNTNSKYRNMRNDLANKVGLDAEKTFDFDTGKEVKFKDGYQVSFQTTDSETFGENGFMSDDDYDKAVADLGKSLGSKPYLGVFGREPEVSFHAKTLDDAFKLATKYNQHSVYDWAKGDIVENPFFDGSKNKVNR